MSPFTRLGHALLVVAALTLLGRQPAVAAAPRLAPPPAPAPRHPATVYPPPGCTTTTTTYVNLTPQALLDNTTITSTVSVAGLPPTLWQVEARTALSHTFPGDLEIYLNSPYPFDTPGTLSTRNGGSADNSFANTQWSDRAFLGVTEVSFGIGVNQPDLIPEGAMGNYRFHDPNGVWQLIVRDKATSDTGTLNGWSLHLTTLNEPYVSASQFPHNPTDQAIANPGTTTSTIQVSQAGEYLMNLTVQTVISHSASGDLTLTLTAPSGLTTTLTHERGGLLDNLYHNTTWTDSPIYSPGPVTDATYVDGQALAQVQPEGALGHFVGSDPNGTWTLTIKDSSGLNAGLLKDWSLGLYTGACQPVYLPAVQR